MLRQPLTRSALQAGKRAAGGYGKKAFTTSRRQQAEVQLTVGEKLCPPPNLAELTDL